MAITRVQDGAPEPDPDPKVAYVPMQPSALLNNWNAMVSHCQVTHAQVLLYCTNYTFKTEQKEQNTLLLPPDKIASPREGLRDGETEENV